MKINIIIEKNKEGQFGRCGFQIVGRSKEHLAFYLPQVKNPEASQEELYTMHSIMRAIVYAKKNLKRLKYILFNIKNMPKVTKEWHIMEEFNKRTLPNIKIEYKRV